MGVEERKERKLAATFRKWLFLAVAIVFILSEQLGWVAITRGLVDDAESELESQLESMESFADTYGFLEDYMKSLGADDDVASMVAGASITGTIAGYHFWDDGVVALAVNDVVVAANHEELQGKSFSDAVGEGADSRLSKILDGGLIEDRRLPGLEGLYYSKYRLGTYATDYTSVDYGLLVALPKDEVLYMRLPVALWLAVALAVLLAVVYVIVMRLLAQSVLRNIDIANEALSEITAGDLDRKVDQTGITEFNSLSNGINTTVGALKRSMDEIQGRIDRELATAKAIQESALPGVFPPFPEIDAFDLYASMNAAREVGGDFYDFFLLDGNRVGIVIADVSGKGIPAALFMMGAKAEIRSCMESGMGLIESMQTANYQLCQGNDASMFVTVLAAILDYETGHVEYVNAGHNPPLVRRDGTWEWLQGKSGLFLGAYPKIRFKLKEFDMGKGDMLFLYTDGVTEAWSPDEELYGEERLETFMRQHSNLHPRAMVDALRRNLALWANGAEQADDVTMLALEFGIPPLFTDSIEVQARTDELERVTNFVNAELARRTCPVSAQNKVDICLEELFVNVANYAYGEGSGTVRISYAYLPNPRGIRVEIADDGIAFDPLEKEDPDMPTSAEDLGIGGLGIFMTKTMSDAISYERREGQNVTAFEVLW